MLASDFLCIWGPPWSSCLCFSSTEDSKYARSCQVYAVLGVELRASDTLGILEFLLLWQSPRTRSSSERRGSISPCTSTSQSVTEGSRGRNWSRAKSLEAGAHRRQWRMLFTGLLLAACPVCFLYSTQDHQSRGGTAHSAVPFRINHQSRERITDLPGGAFSQLMFSLPKWLEAVSNWHRN